MQVFIVGTPLETASALDPRRLNKQIVECQQILDALSGAKAWSNHPCTLQYKGHEEWLESYMECLKRYKDDDYGGAEEASAKCMTCFPIFHIQPYKEQMKRRLYTKDSWYYSRWAYLGTSEVNWYYVENEWRYYKNGKRVKESI